MDTRIVSARLQGQLVDRYEEAEEASPEENSSAFLRSVIVDGLDARERRRQKAVGQGVSPLALLGVGSLAGAPTLLATGYTLLGAIVGAVAAAYLLLWVTATDDLVEEALGSARAELRAVGGVSGFLRVLIFEDRVVDEPETLVEKLTYADVAAAGLVALATVLALPLWVATRVGLLEVAIEVVGGLGVLAFVAGLIVLVYASVFLLGVSAIATLAVAYARQGRGGAPSDDEGATEEPPAES
jgi:hypothetical protein